MIDTAKLIEFNKWANRRILEQVKMLPNDLFTKELGGSFPSIRLTMLHLLESDWIWMNRWRGIPILEIPQDWSTDTALDLITFWTPLQDQMEAIVRDLATDPNKAIAFITKKGAPYTMPFLDLVIHVTNHGTYHRGQIVNMIRMLGEQPVNTDYFIFCNLTSK
jgi:uncharacterized damage-inducible protein DinB